MDTLADLELAWTSYDKLAKMFKERRNPDGKREHPTQKPLDLMKWCVQFADKHEKVETVFDPFAGSGTALVASKYLGKKFIGCEAVPKYCEIANQRLRQD